MFIYPFDMNISLLWILYKNFEDLVFFIFVSGLKVGERPHEGIYRWYLCTHKTFTGGASGMAQKIEKFVPQPWWPEFEPRNPAKCGERES